MSDNKEKRELANPCEECTKDKEWCSIGCPIWNQYNTQLKINKVYKEQDDLIRRAYRALAYNASATYTDKLLNDLEDYINSKGDNDE